MWGVLGYILFISTLVDPWSVTVVRDCYLGVSLLKLCWFWLYFGVVTCIVIDLCPFIFLHYVVMWFFGLSLALHVGKSCCSCSGSWLFYRLGGYPSPRIRGGLVGELCLVLTVWPGTYGRRRKINPSLLLPLCTLKDRGLWYLLIIEMMSWRFTSSLW